MAKRPSRGVKIRLTRERLEALHSICDEMLKTFKPENKTELLMREYLKELHYVLNSKIKTEQCLYTVHMTGMEAISFRQLWDVLNIKNDKYASILIRSILGQIDRYNEAHVFS